MFDQSLIDLSQLVGGDSFTTPCTLSLNGIGVITPALCDTGANGFLFIHTRFATALSFLLGADLTLLDRKIPLKGFDGKASSPVTQALFLNISIDGRRQLLAPFLMIDIGGHDIIIGRKWFSYFNIHLDPRKRRLIWPSYYPPTPYFGREIMVPRDSLRQYQLDPWYQEDTYYRQRLFDIEDSRSVRKGSTALYAIEELEWPPSRTGTIRAQAPPAPTVEDCPEPMSQEEALEALILDLPELPVNPNLGYKGEEPVEPLTTTDKRWTWDQRDAYEAMNNALYSLSRSPTRRLKEQRIKGSLPFSIAHISAQAFRLNLHQKENLVFGLSLHELDRLIELTELEEAMPDIAELSPEETDEECIERMLPKVYQHFQDVCSKAASDTLPPHRPYDHKIELTRDNDLKFSPLYGHSSEELKVLKQYLVDNLNKGFIEASQAPFAAPVLFVKKPGGGLRFCIDFRKLNAITRKDQYPLPLIDETLARLGKAKIFTKLDIRQAFHRIRIHPDSEELTTFRTRYGSYKCKVLPFGLTNGPSTYQRYMNDVLFDYLDDFCTAYLDDILIYSETLEEHEAQVKKVLQRLREAGLQVDLKKCEFSIQSTRYLGFIVSTDGVSVDPEKVSAIRNW